MRFRRTAKRNILDELSLPVIEIGTRNLRLQGPLPFQCVFSVSHIIFVVPLVVFLPDGRSTYRIYFLCSRCKTGHIAENGIKLVGVLLHRWVVPASVSQSDK